MRTWTHTNERTNEEKKQYMPIDLNNLIIQTITYTVCFAKWKIPSQFRLLIHGFQLNELQISSKWLFDKLCTVYVFMCTCVYVPCTHASHTERIWILLKQKCRQKIIIKMSWATFFGSFHNFVVVLSDLLTIQRWFIWLNHHLYLIRVFYSLLHNERCNSGCNLFWYHGATQKKLKSTKWIGK